MELEKKKQIKQTAAIAHKFKLKKQKRKARKVLNIPSRVIEPETVQEQPVAVVSKKRGGDWLLREHERVQEERRINEEQRTAETETREAEKKTREKERNTARRQAFAKTHKGQPIMSRRIDALLAKLEKTKK